MPPIAQKIGKSACFMFDNSPTKNSRLISKPTNKKKTAIKPSFTQCKRFLDIAAPPTWNDISVCQKSLYTCAQPELAHIKAITALKSKTIPLDACL